MTHFEVLGRCTFRLCRNRCVGTRLYGHVDSGCNVAVFDSFRGIRACLCRDMARNRFGGFCGDVTGV
jgi:hypothetical protein